MRDWSCHYKLERANGWRLTQENDDREGKRPDRLLLTTFSTAIRVKMDGVRGDKVNCLFGARPRRQPVSDAQYSRPLHRRKNRGRIEYSATFSTTRTAENGVGFLSGIVPLPVKDVCTQLIF